MHWLFPVALCAAILLVTFFVIGLWLRRLQARRAREVLEKLAGQELLGVTSSCLFFGQESLGMAQVRGNAVLVLTPEELYSEMWTPRRATRIPVGSILSVSTPKSHLGKSKFRPLLKVTYTNEAGAEDSAAWLVANLELWCGALSKLARARQQAQSESESEPG